MGGGLLVKGKHKLLSKIDADTSQIQAVLIELGPDYRAAPAVLYGYDPPQLSDVIEALDGISEARRALPGQSMLIQTELGDVCIPEIIEPVPDEVMGLQEVIKNHGIELLRVKAPDMIGSAQWTVVRGGRNTKVEILHKGWLEAYHRREHTLLPGDSLRCRYEEQITYDAAGTELERKLSILEVLGVVTPPQQNALDL